MSLENEQQAKDDVGQFEMLHTGEARYSPECQNMVETISSIPRTQLNVYWRAPKKPGTGCILIRATVFQHRDVWFRNDSSLTKRICEEIADNVENHSQTTSFGQDICCSCDEARYEVNISLVFVFYIFVTTYIFVISFVDCI